MRIKPVRSRLVPFGSGLQALNSGEPSPSKCGLLNRITRAQFKSVELEPAVHELVERRVRGSLKLVQRGELTPQQALRAVVNRLADELTDSQYQNLITYFVARDTKGQLVPAKQLLLKQLTAAKGLQSLPSSRDQQPNWDIENRATPAPSPARQTGTAVIGIADLGLRSLISPDCNTDLFDTAKQINAVGSKPVGWNQPASHGALYQLDI